VGEARSPHTPAHSLIDQSLHPIAPRLAAARWGSTGGGPAHRKAEATQCRNIQAPGPGGRARSRWRQGQRRSSTRSPASSRSATVDRCGSLNLTPASETPHPVRVRW